MPVIVVVQVKKMAKPPMRAFVAELEQVSGHSVEYIPLDTVPGHTVGPSTFLIHKPESLLSNGNVAQLEAYLAFERQCDHVLDSLYAIGCIHLRHDLHCILSQNPRIILPPSLLLVGNVEPLRQWIRDSNSPLLIKSNDSNTHRMHIFANGDVLLSVLENFFCPAFPDIRSPEVKPLVYQLLKDDVRFLPLLNTTYVVEKYIIHNCVLKLYTFRGEILYYEFRDSLPIPSVPYQVIDSQVDNSIQRTIDGTLTDAQRIHAAELAEAIYTLTHISIIGIDILLAADAMYVIDVNYFSGPKPGRHRILAEAIHSTFIAVGDIGVHDGLSPS
ncbi:hypothetical protein GMRT_12730 [Giardia muris]|uniref:Uncharacterized protein n=1 Tax=Giardia muris TaxID=5742 RepID=A0A4Z1SRR0_GIAMU|nr:hypothetical protein GMRT_12730 [Giardia muris]|eukprot:TNJ28566.1 hypothetical protein GMRT_12730 [Giardia muris]